MSRISWMYQSLITLSGRQIRRLALISASGLLLFAGMWEFRAAADSQSAPASAQGRKRLAAQKKFDEAEALQKQETAESLRMAAQKYQEALSLWREIGDEQAEADTLHS